MDKQLVKKIMSSLTFKFPYTLEDYCENLYLENYHCHKDFSNTAVADSPSSISDYAKRIKELNAKCLYSGEHGNQGNQFEVYECAEKNELKYIHSSEAYWVKDRHEKDRTNCHMMIVATNEEGREDLNYILSIANEDGYYGKPRIDLELLLSIKPENFIVTSACIAGWKYEDAEDIWLEIANHFGDNFFIEVQNHNTTSQKELNKKLLRIANENNLQIICGLDSHYINEDIDSIKRNKILEYKKTFYEDEDGWYLDYPDSSTIYNRFIEQGILNEEQIIRAMMNTNVFVSKCQEIKIDRSFKIPSVYKDKTYNEKVEIFKNLLNQQYRLEKSRSKEKKEGIRYEANEIIESGVVDYFLTNYYGLKDAVENEGGILTTTSRGSMASYIVNKLLGFTTIDRFNSEVPIYPERFLTKERVLSGQMPDCDFNVASQEPFVRAFKKLIGEHSVYPLMAIEKFKEKAAWQMYASINDVPPQTANEISKYIDQYNEKLKYLDEEDKDGINIEDFIPNEYISIYNQSKAYQGITINLKVHACGYIMLEGDVRRKIGLISAVSETTKKRTLVACIEGGYLDAFGLVKNDFLIVDSVALTKECFDSIGEPVPTFDELREMIRDDEPTWGIYEQGITVCVNQLERTSTANKAKIYRPRDLGELSAFIAAIRPGFRSLLPNFIERKPYTTGEDKIDKILEDSFHYMLYQESIMKVLSCLSLTMGETYGVIKGISKKKMKGEKLKKLQEQLLEGWKSNIGELDNFNSVWQVVEDASKYSFNCLSKDTIVYKPSTKKSLKPLTIEEMFLIKNDINYARETNHLSLCRKYRRDGYGKALSLFDDNKLHYNTILEIYDAGFQETYIVRTESGKSVDCTMEHKFPTPNGKMPLKDLRIGDSLYIKGTYAQQKFDASLTDGSFQPNYPKNGEKGFQNNVNGVSVIYDNYRNERILNKSQCEICGKIYSREERFEVHHKDDNRKNNKESNFSWVCASCHKKEHYKNGRIKTYEKGIEVYLDKIISIDYKTTEHVYNLSMADPAHNFVVNDGIVTSNSPHSLSMGGDSAYLAWFKAHHTAKFYEVAINHYHKKDNKKKIEALVDEIIRFYGYEMGEYCFGDDNRKVTVDEEKKIIYPSLGSIKNMSKVAPECLYEMKDLEFANRYELYEYLINNTPLNKTDLEILFKIDYFRKFGNPNQMLYEFSEVKNYITSKVLTKDKLSGIELRAISKCKFKATAKQIREFDNIEFINNILDIAQTEISTTFNQKISYQVQILGNTQLTDSNSNLYVVQSYEFNNYRTPFITLYQISTGISQQYKADKKFYNQFPLEVGDIIESAFRDKTKRTKINDEWVDLPEQETVLSAWAKQNI